MSRFYWDRELRDWVEYDPHAPRPEPRAPMIMRDTPEYRSPIDGRLITSRSARREDLKRSGCVEYEPSLSKRPAGLVTDPKYARNGLRHDPSYAQEFHDRRAAAARDDAGIYQRSAVA